jgi:CRP-like cAMP-binding protein
VSSALSATQITGNLFLDNLPPAVLQGLHPSFSPITLQSGRVICDSDEAIEIVIFPVNSILSVVLEMSDGDTAEVGLIGREGMSGLPIVLGISTSNQRTIVQVPDGAHCISAEDFRVAVERDSDLKACALRYAQATLMTTSQMSACNTLHPTNERCARWLLMAHDRVDADRVLLTQEFLSQMLGVRRGAVTLAASALQEAGFISYSRGLITVLNRSGLEAASCECYETIERNWVALMGYSTRKSKAQTGKVGAHDGLKTNL